MTNLVAFIILSVLFYLTNGEGLGCGPDEVLNTCASLCIGEPTCEDLKPTQKPDTACPEVCVERCECDAARGLIRSCADEKCIKRKNCPNQTNCPKHEHEDCDPCCPDPTCQNRNPYCPPDKICTKICRLTCRCDKGFIRDTSTGACVPSGQCPKCKA